MTLERVLKTLIDGVSNDRSPYGINGYPFVKPLARRDDAILYVHPKTVQTREGFEFVEVPGVSSQWRNADGWLDQARAMPMADMAAELAKIIQAGGRWVDPDNSDENLPRWYIGSPREASYELALHPEYLSSYDDRVMAEEHTKDGEILMQLETDGELRQAYLRTDGKLDPITRDEIEEKAYGPEMEM
jgi:hypothetical protein